MQVVAHYPLVTLVCGDDPASALGFPNAPQLTHIPQRPYREPRAQQSVPRASPDLQPRPSSSAPAPVLTSPHGPHALTPEGQPAVQPLCPSSRRLLPCGAQSTCPPFIRVLPSISPVPACPRWRGSPHPGLLGQLWSRPPQGSGCCCFLVTEGTETWEVGSDSAGSTPTCPKPGHSLAL